MTDQIALKSAVSLPAGFAIREVSPNLLKSLNLPVTPPLGPLAAFTGTFTGNGFNTIFRPDSPQTPTPLPIQMSSDNVLELNLTQETLSFSPPLGSVPNRGMVQADVFLNGVPYLQSINDVTTGAPAGIHLEPGLWIAIPATSNPKEGVTVARMASIPHGTTINAQGTSTVINGPPVIPAVDITPFATTNTGVPGGKISFPSQIAANKETPRIPQDLTSFIAAGTITQAMITDPNSVLRAAIAGQKITSTTVITIATTGSTPTFGGGTDNIAFLLGDAAALTNPAAPGPNAQTLKMTATFWIETVQHTIQIPVFKPGQKPLTIAAPSAGPGHPVAQFVIDPPVPITAPRTITVTSTQIQYSQTVFLNFNGLTWPHVSVATLVPAGTVAVPPSAWA
jgi:hypothetical protein